VVKVRGFGTVTYYSACNWITQHCV